MHLGRCTQRGHGKLTYSAREVGSSILWGAPTARPPV
jgi:hypothetical protein